MIDINNFKPAFAIHPGRSLKDQLEIYEMTQYDLAKRTGITKKHINEFINGKTHLTPEMSYKLENVLGIPSSYWNNLESNYQDTLTRLDDIKSMDNEYKIMREIPYNEMSKLNWVPKTRNIKERVNYLRKYFGVADLEFISQILPAAFRLSSKKKASSYSLAAWLRKGELSSQNISAADFNKNKLRELIPEFRHLTNESITSSQNKLKDLCAQCGIILLFVPHLSKTYANGATRWLTPKKALIQLSIRGKFADIFWFSFFHEIGHIYLNHSKKRTFISNIIKNENEIQADKFASNILIPEKYYSQFINNESITKKSISLFSQKLKIHPGIIVGRLSHNNIITYNKFHELREQYDWKSQ